MNAVALAADDGLVAAREESTENVPVFFWLKRTAFSPTARQEEERERE